MKKRFVMLMLGLSIMITPMSVCAAPTATEQTAAESTVSNSEETSAASTETVQETTETQSVEDTIPEPEGDEGNIIQAMTTSQSDKTPCQINITAKVPDKFGLSICADVQNTDTGVIYELPLYSDNQYTQRCFVPTGKYTVTNIGVYNDATDTYPFSYPEDFEVKDKDCKDLDTTLTNYDEVAKQIQDKVDKVEGNDETEPDEESTTPVRENEELTVDTDFEIVHTGTGTGIVGITGSQSQIFSPVIKVTKSGILGTAKMVYSMDNGKTWMPETDIPLIGKVDLSFINEKGVQKSSGLTANFNADILEQEKGFVKGDTYATYVCDPMTELKVDHEGSSSVDLSVSTIDKSKHVFDVLYNAGKSIKVTVARDGKLGVAVIQISEDGGKTYADAEYVPKNGQIELKDAGIILTFTSRGDNALTAGDSYTVIPVKKTNTKIYITIGIFVVLLLAAYKCFADFMKKQVPGAGSYKIFTYNPVQVSDEPSSKASERHKKNKKGDE